MRLVSAEVKQTSECGRLWCRRKNIPEDITAVVIFITTFMAKILCLNRLMIKLYNAC